MTDFLHNLEWTVPLRHPWLPFVFETFTMLGRSQSSTGPDRHSGTRLTLVVLVSALLNYFVKDLFLDPRPLEFRTRWFSILTQQQD